MVCSKTIEHILFLEICILDDFKSICFLYFTEVYDRVLISCILNSWKVGYWRVKLKLKLVLPLSYRWYKKLWCYWRLSWIPVSANNAWTSSVISAIKNSFQHFCTEHTSSRIIPLDPSKACLQPVDFIHSSDWREPTGREACTPLLMTHTKLFHQMEDPLCSPTRKKIKCAWE